MKTIKEALELIKRKQEIEKGCGKTISSDEGTCNYCGEFIKCKECQAKSVTLTYKDEEQFKKCQAKQNSEDKMPNIADAYEQGLELGKAQAKKDIFEIINKIKRYSEEGEYIYIEELKQSITKMDTKAKE